jgi:hypothetical protein
MITIDVVVSEAKNTSTRMCQRHVGTSIICNLQQKLGACRYAYESPNVVVGNVVALQHSSCGFKNFKSKIVWSTFKTPKGNNCMMSPFPRWCHFGKLKSISFSKSKGFFPIQYFTIARLIYWNFLQNFTINHGLTNRYGLLKNNWVFSWNTSQ